MAVPIVRDPRIDLTQVPKHWLAGNVVGTAIANGVNMLFPIGERYFVRSVNHYFDRLTDPLREQVKAFYKQEGHHAAAHDRLNAVMRSHGFEIDSFLDRYNRIGTWLERHVPAKLNLAATAAAEHYTAILADGAFTKGMLDAMDPAMQQLLAWHAAEEIEHKAVAFDVLRVVDPSYAWRMAGLVHATMMLAGFWAWAAVMLVRQEKLGVRGVLAELGRIPKRDRVLRRVFLTGIRQYIRRDFHPNDHANEDLAREWFAAHGLPFAEAV